MDEVELQLNYDAQVAENTELRRELEISERDLKLQWDNMSKVYEIFGWTRGRVNLWVELKKVAGLVKEES